MTAARPEAFDAAPDCTADAIAPDASAPASLEEALEALRAAGLDAAATTISGRVAQRRSKMKLSDEEGMRAATATLRHAVSNRNLARLHEVMPRSTVELCRAVDERGLPIAQADAIASYLVEVVEVMDFARLETFDENHSHVTGRDWHQIDYSGEGMTWRSQKRFWAPRGVESFKRAEYIHAYLVRAEKMAHFARVYRPRGSMDDVAAPR